MRKLFRRIEQSVILLTCRRNPMLWMLLRMAYDAENAKA